MISCSFLIFVGIILLFLGVGTSIRFRIAGLMIPGGIGTMMIAIGLLLKLLGKC